MRQAKTTCWQLLLLIALIPLAHAPAFSYVATVNSTDHTEMHILPTPGKIVIDGDLHDWDLSGAIFMKLDESSKDIYSVRGAMMYDAEALYIGGQMKDPTPMLNNYAFTDDPGMVWNADAIQVRFVSDPSLKSNASLQSGGQGLSAEQAKYICHMTLWYSTRDQQAGFQIAYTLNFSDGLLNPPTVSGAWKKDTDGKGCVFEYRIPWAILHAPRAFHGGDQVQTTWQMNWGMDIGQGLIHSLTDVRNPNSGDLGYMGPGAWGTGIVEKAGHITLVEKTTMGRPQGDIPIAFTLAKDGKVSLAICDARGNLVRTCLGAEPYKAGKQTYLWDGLDDKDRPLPAGKYTAKILTHDGVAPKLVCDVGVSGSPPYQTENGAGGWAGDYRTPWNLACDGDDVVLGTSSSEAASPTIATDLEGKKRYGTSVGGGCLALALHGGFGYFAQSGSGTLQKFNLENGYLSPFADGQPEVQIFQRQPGESNQDWGDRSWSIGAVAIDDNEIIESNYRDNKLYFADLATGAPKSEATLQEARGLAVAPDGTLYAVSANAVGKFDLKTNTFTPIIDGLDTPRHLACDAAGNVYVSLQGNAQQVWKIAPSGKVLLKYGTPGGRPALGKFNPDGMLDPYAIAVDRNGRLWVAEADNQPKRYSVWNADGKLYKDFYGSLDYSTHASADPTDPQYVYAQMVRYRVDYQQGTWQVDSTFLRSTSSKSIEFAGPSPISIITRYQGRKFLWTSGGWGAAWATLYELTGDTCIPRMSVGRDKWWLDDNNNGLVDDNEIRTGRVAPQGSFAGFPMDSHMNIYYDRGPAWADQGGTWTEQPFQILRWSFLGFNAQGGLRYGDPNQLTVVASGAGGSIADYMADDDGNIYVLLSGGTLQRGTRAQGSGHRVVKFSPDGKLCWEYQNVHCAFAWTSENYFPGYMVGAESFAGSTKDLIAVTGYYGQYFLLDKKDGLFVDALGDDQRSAYTMGPQMVLTENFNGFLFRHPGNGRTYFIGGDADDRLWEVTGLDTIKRQAVPVTVTAAMAEKSQENARSVEAAGLGVQGAAVTVARLTGAAADGKYDEWTPAKTLPIMTDADRSAVAQLGYDDANLYARFQVTGASSKVGAPSRFNSASSKPAMRSRRWVICA